MTATSVLNDLRSSQSNTWVDKEVRRSAQLEAVRSGKISSPENFAVGGVRAVKVALHGGGSVSAIDPSNAQSIPGQSVTVLTDTRGRSALLGRSANR